MIRPVTTLDPGLSRREFLRTAGFGVAGVLVLGSAACSSTTKVATSAFRSRPDLKPPVMTVTKAEGAALAPGRLFVTAGGPLILDDEGSPIWVHPLIGTAATNLRVQTYHGAPVLTWWEGQTAIGYGAGDYVIADTSYRELRRVRAGNGLQGDLHEFVITPEGTALFSVYDRTTADLSPAGRAGTGPVLQGIIQEVDIDSGTVVFEWRSIDHVGLDESHSPLPTVGQPFDYFHVNSVEVDHDGNLLVSARNTWTVYKLDRRSGTGLWHLGGKRSSFAMGSGTDFEWQHDARRRPDGTLTLFDNGAAPNVEELSRGLVLTLDERAATAALVQQYTHPAVLATSQGNLQTLPNDDVLIGWGAEPYFTEFSKDGQLLFDARFPTGVGSYRAFRFPWTATPTEAPAVAALAGAGDRVDVYASWNGATEVARWEALAGSKASSLRPVGSAPRSGFETTIAVHTAASLVAARALDEGGKVLATSPAVRV